MFNRLTLAASLVAIALAAPASAQYRNDGRWLGGAAQFAYDRGYREGSREGAKDARDRDFELERESKYRKADDGYKKEYGNKDAYRRAYRQGYATGYTDAYNGRAAGVNYPGARPRAVPRGTPTYPGRYPTPAYPGSPTYPVYGSQYPAYGSEYQLARDNGYRDGVEKGREDWRKNRSGDPLRHDWYRSADRGYDDDDFRFSKDAYRNAYREGFRAGYDVGYRQTAW